MKSIIAEYRYHFWLHLIVFLFGFTGILGKVISVDSTVLVWYRVMIGFISIGIYMLLVRENTFTSPKALIKIMATGLVTATHWVCFFESIKQANVSVALICLSSTTFFTSLIEPVFHKRSIRPYEVIFGLVTIIGLSIIFNIEDGYQTGVIFGLISAFLAAVFSVINSILIRTYPSKLISLWELIGGFAGLSVYLFIVTTPHSFKLTNTDLGYLLILGIICTAFAFVVSVEIMKYLTPYTTNITINLEPVYGILLALAIFGESEKMSPGFYLGTVIILTVIFANAWMKRKENRRKSRALNKL